MSGSDNEQEAGGPPLGAALIVKDTGKIISSTPVVGQNIQAIEVRNGGVFFKDNNAEVVLDIRLVLQDYGMIISGKPNNTADTVNKAMVIKDLFYDISDISIPPAASYRVNFTESLRNIIGQNFSNNGTNIAVYSSISQLGLRITGEISIQFFVSTGSPGNYDSIPVLKFSPIDNSGQTFGQTKGSVEIGKGVKNLTNTVELNFQATVVTLNYQGEFNFQQDLNFKLQDYSDVSVIGPYRATEDNELTILDSESSFAFRNNPSAETLIVDLPTVITNNGGTFTIGDNIYAISPDPSESSSINNIGGTIVIGNNSRLYGGDSLSEISGLNFHGEDESSPGVLTLGDASLVAGFNIRNSNIQLKTTSKISLFKVTYSYGDAGPTVDIMTGLSLSWNQPSDENAPRITYTPIEKIPNEDNNVFNFGDPNIEYSTLPEYNGGGSLQNWINNAGNGEYFAGGYQFFGTQDLGQGVGDYSNLSDFVKSVGIVYKEFDSSGNILEIYGIKNGEDPQNANSFVLYSSGQSYSMASDDEDSYDGSYPDTTQ